MTDKRIIGHEPNQSPSNSMLGRLAYTDDINVLNINGDDADYLPDVRPSVHFDSQAERLADTMGFKRFTNATYVGRNGFIQYATYGKPRFDFDPITLENRGVLVEETSTNTVTYSYSGGQWGVSNGTTTVNDTKVRAPDGSYTATRFTKAQSVNSQSNVQIECSISSTTFTASAYVRPFSTNKIFFQFTSAPNIVDNLYFYIDFDTLTWQYVDYNGSDDSGPHRVQIDEFGQGWYRVSITVRGFAEPGLYSGMRIGTYTSTNNHVYTDTNNHSFFVWGAQMESGQWFSTSYIRTSGSQATRLADEFRGRFSSYKESGNDNFTYYQLHGHTIFVEFDYQKEIEQDEYTGIVEMNGIGGNNSSNRHNLALYRGGYLQNGTEGPVYSQLITSGAVNVGVEKIGWPARLTQRELHRVAMTVNYDSSESDSASLELSVDGVYAGISSSTAIGDPSEFGEIIQYTLGDIGGITQLNGHIKRFYIYPKALTRRQMNWLTGEDDE